jgi:hypothetical protein
MITPIFTTPWAQWSYDTVQERGISTDAEVFTHGYLQLANMLSHTAIPIHLTRMSNPHVMSYAYAGIDASKYGIKAAIADRRAFQIASSPAYQAGEKLAKRIGMKTGARTAGRIAARAIPGLGWAMLAYDAYDLVANQRLFGVQL